MPRKKMSAGYGARAGNGAVASLQDSRAALMAERGRVDQALAAIDNAIKALGSAPAGGWTVAARPAAAASAAPKAGGRRKTSFRRGSVKEYITRALSTGRPMAVKDITNAVKKMGYKSKNKTLAKSVGLACAQMPNIAKVGRGQFRLK